MRASSVVALVLCRDNGGEQLALLPAERRGAEHDRLVHRHRRPHDLRVGAHRADDVVDLPGPLDGCGVLLGEQPLGLLGIDQADVRHAADPTHGAGSLIRGAAWARWPSRSSKPVRCGSPTLGRFDSGAAPLSRLREFMRERRAPLGQLG